MGREESRREYDRELISMSCKTAWHLIMSVPFCEKAPL